MPVFHVTPGGHESSQWPSDPALCILACAQWMKIAGLFPKVFVLDGLAAGLDLDGGAIFAALTLLRLILAIGYQI
jgi:hypothetical protein